LNNRRQASGNSVSTYPEPHIPEEEIFYDYEIQAITVGSFGCNGAAAVCVPTCYLLACTIRHGYNYPNQYTRASHRHTNLNLHPHLDFNANFDLYGDGHHHAPAGSLRAQVVPDRRRPSDRPESG
jgi:hypothetical protein